MSDDAELVAAALAGGPEHFGPVVQRYQDAVFGVALARLRSYHDAQDVTQEVFVGAYWRLGDLKDPSRLGAWLRSITIHKCIDHQRRRRGDVAIDDTVEPASDHPRPDAALEQRELRAQVLAAIGRLSKTQRETTTLFYINGYSVAEVAAIQEVPIGTIKWRLHQAREKLKEEMIGMVENVLKSEAPKEDLAQRVFEIVSRYERLPIGDEDGPAVFRELRRIGAERGIDGFIRAFESPHAGTRGMAVSFAVSFHSPADHEEVCGLVKRALRDVNQGVRLGAMSAALNLAARSDETRQELVPVVLELLLDRAKGVRQRTSWELQQGWAAEVPLETAARALVEETNPGVRQVKEDLLRAVLDAQAPGAEPATGPDDVDEWLSRLKEDLKSPDTRIRSRGMGGLFDLLGYCTGGTRLMSSRRPRLRLSDRRSRQEVLRRLAGMLTDRARRIRWRAAWQLLPWAADVPIDLVAKARRGEAHARVRQHIETLLDKAKEEQQKTS